MSTVASFSSEENLRYSCYLKPTKGVLPRLPARSVSLEPEIVSKAMLQTFKQKDYVCVGATAAFATDEYRIGIYQPIGTSEATAGLARDLAKFIDEQRESKSSFTTFMAVFSGDQDISEHDFEKCLWD